MNAVRTHIEHFIGSNPSLASTSCTDPVTNLNSPSKRARVDTPPKIVLNLSRVDHSTDGRDKTAVRSRSCSPFWVQGQTSTYSEVVKTGRVATSRPNSRSASPEDTGRESRRLSGVGPLLAVPRMTRTRSKSPKDKNTWRRHDKNVTSTEDDSMTSVAVTNAAPDTKRRSRSRKNRSRKKDVGHQTTVTVATAVTLTPEIVVSDARIRSNDVVCNRMDGPPKRTDRDDDHDGTSASASRELLHTDDDTVVVAVPRLRDTAADLTTYRWPPGGDYSDRCLDLNERLMGIFGSVDKQHYKHSRVFDRPRSKSDTRDLNTLAQIFTGSSAPNDDSATTCRFERSSPESVKYNSNRDITTSGSRRSFDHYHVLSSPFAQHDAPSPPPPPPPLPPPPLPSIERRRSDDHRPGGHQPVR